MKHKLPELSIFFPAYNEAGNIEEAVKQALSFVPKVADKYEIIIVNDGSNDATLPIAKRLARKYKAVRVVTQRNKGYGGALKLGFKSVRYDWIFYTDADLQFDITELKRFVSQARKHDLVIGYRKKRVEGWKRQVFASALKVWNRVMLAFPLHVGDIDCAFKLFHRRVLRNVEPLISDGAMLSTEFLMKAHQAGLECAQVGVTHYARRVGTPTGNNWKVIARAVRDTFILKKHLLKKAPAYRIARTSYQQLHELALGLT